jgi:mitotic spindle assembly checkpoint protein MAD2
VGGKISKLVVVVTSKDTGEIVERWQFDVSVLDRASTGSSESKSSEEIQKEIQAIIRQITASVTFLPLMEDQCTFNVLVYADSDAEVPVEWADSGPKNVENGEQVKLRSFSTDSHQVNTLVAYKLGGD